MYTALNVRDYRGLRSADLKLFTNLNVLVGPNGCGKSAVLEAIFLAAAQDAKALSEVCWLQRGSEQDPDAVSWLFYGSQRRSNRAQIVLRGETDILVELSHVGHSAYTVKYEGSRFRGEEMLTWPQDFQERALRRTHAKFVDAGKGQVALPVLYTEAVQAGSRQAVTDLVQSLVPGAQGLEILTSSEGRPDLNLVFGNGALPVATLGDGLKTIIRQCLELSSPFGSCVLMEEPEAFKHPAAIWRIAQTIAIAAKERQIFLSTHSLELIDALLGSSVDLARVAVYRLSLDEGKLVYSRLSGSEARELRSAIEEDLR